MSGDVLAYHPMDESGLRTAQDKQTRFIKGFIASNKYDGDKIYVNENALLAVIVKVDQRRRYFHFFHKLDMSEYKEAALYSFWYIKLHPLNIGPRDFLRDPPSMYDSINEKLALYVIFKTLRTMLKKKKLPTERLDELPLKYIDELVYSLTYRDVSKESLIMLVESMAVFLGLDPYAKEK